MGKLRKSMKKKGAFFQRQKQKPLSPPGEVTPLPQKKKKHKKHK